MKKLLPVLVAWLALAGLTRAQPQPPTGYNTGMPFGLIGPKELDHLEVRARKDGVDIMGDMKRAYQKDDAALARVYAYSLKFTKLDRDARTYGQIIYSSFLNLGATQGIERFSRVVAAQPEEVRQRVRDFIYYDATQAPKNVRPAAEASARKEAPLLFPTEYVFAAGDPLFQKS